MIFIQPLISKSANASSLVVGQAITYTVVVRNNGPSDAIGATVHDVLPAEITGLSLVSCTSTGTASCVSSGFSGNTFSATVNLPNGTTATYVISGTISSLPSSGHLINEAGIQRPADVTDPNLTNPSSGTPPVASLQGVIDECNAFSAGSGNGSSPTCNNLKVNSVTVTPGSADLQVTKTGPTTVNSNGTVNYTVAVINAASSTSAANGATINDAIPGTLIGVSIVLLTDNYTSSRFINHNTLINKN